MYQYANVFNKINHIAAKFKVYNSTTTILININIVIS